MIVKMYLTALFIGHTYVYLFCKKIFGSIVRINKYIYFFGSLREIVMVILSYAIAGTNIINSHIFKTYSQCLILFIFKQF